MSIARYAEQLQKMEGGNSPVVMGTAHLLDIGIHEAEKKYGSTSGQYQEISSVTITAREKRRP